jgi:hypothetical protein
MVVWNNLKDAILPTYPLLLNSTPLSWLKNLCAPDRDRQLHRQEGWDGGEGPR